MQGSRMLRCFRRNTTAYQLGLLFSALQWCESSLLFKPGSALPAKDKYRRAEYMTCPKQPLDTA